MSQAIVSPSLFRGKSFSDRRLAGSDHRRSPPEGGRAMLAQSRALLAPQHFRRGAEPRFSLVEQRRHKTLFPLPGGEREASEASRVRGRTSHDADPFKQFEWEQDRFAHGTPAVPSAARIDSRLLKSGKTCVAPDARSCSARSSEAMPTNGSFRCLAVSRSHLASPTRAIRYSLSLSPAAHSIARREGWFEQLVAIGANLSCLG